MTTTSSPNGNVRFPIEKAREWLVGPMVAVATPFKEDYSLDLDALRDNIRFMIDGGVRTGNGTLLVGGAGGEHPAMNVDERKAVMDVSMEAADGEVPVATSVQHTDTRVTVDLAQHASTAGLQGVQLGPTYYYVPTESDVSRLFELVASESEVMLMIYHTHWEGLTMGIDLLRELADMPTVGALKWSAPTQDYYEEGLREFSQKLSIIDNAGQHVLSHQLGARGFITHLSGFWPKYTSDIWRLLEAQDYEGAEQLLEKFKYPWLAWREKVAGITGGEGPFIKAAMEEVGLRVGPPRPPSSRAPESALSEFRELLKRAGTPMVAEAVRS